MGKRGSVSKAAGPSGPPSPQKSAPVSARDSPSQEASRGPASVSRFGKRTDQKEYLEHLLQTPEPPTRKDLEEAKMRLACNMDRLEYFQRVTVKFMQLTTRQNEHLRWLIRSYSPKHLEDAFKHGTTDVEAMLANQIAAHKETKTTWRRLRVLDQYIAGLEARARANHGNNLPPDQLPGGMMLAPEDAEMIALARKKLGSTLPTYQELLAEKKKPKGPLGAYPGDDMAQTEPANFPRNDPLMAVTCLRPYRSPTTSPSSSPLRSRMGATVG